MARRYTLTDLALLKSDLGAKLPEPQARKKRGNEEGAMQRLLMHWWHQYASDHNIPECLLFAIPNGSALGHGKEEYQVKQRQIRGKMMKLEGLRPGCPDLMLAVPKTSVVFAGQSHPGLFLEMKLPKGVVSDEQKLFLDALMWAGYKVRVCRSLDEAIKTITEYLT